MGEMDAIVREFIAETRENLDRLDRDLVELEKNPAAKKQLDSIFRAVHSIKGATGFLGFSRLGAVAHVGEGLLSSLREGVLTIDPQITNGLLALVDHVRRTLQNIEQSGVEGEMGDAALIENLTRLQGKKVTSRATAQHGRQGKKLTSAVSPSPSKTTISEQDPPPDQNGPRPGGAANNSVRVDVRQLDKLMNLVGELVLVRNELLQFSSVQQNAVPLGTSQRLNAITTELQDEIMKVRMQPIENVWNKFPRLVRDLALHAGKKVRLDMSGKETELDKTLIEAITDPLTHLVRNAVDHGIETPDARAAAGKPIEGRILLRSSHAGGQVDIEISDDGAGIDLARVKHKAIEFGLATAEQSQHMSDVEAMNLLFLPGFSTVKKVTSVSGRGVGMDVVKTNIEKIGGAVGIESRHGLGTQVKIRIPLTLAIMPALVVTAASNRYAIPQVSVLELMRLEGNEVQRGIEKIQSVAVYRLRGELVPLIWLGAELKTERQDFPASLGKTEDVANIVFLQAGDHKFGLVVDEVNDTQEIVVKPLGRQLRGMSTFAGATIMGDGEVVLILDVLGMAQHAHVIPESHDEKMIRNAVPTQEPIAVRQSLLLFIGPDDARMAIPLSQVTRLEEFSSSLLEYSGGEKVVQYRGEILPLVNICDVLPERRSIERRSSPRSERDKTIHAIVYSNEDCRVGLVVEDIVDTVEHNPVHIRPASRAGVLASVVIDGRITEILDLEAICSRLSRLPSSVLRRQPVEATKV
jgi:two-component system chemotaxis sensor kinase CheA